MEPVYYFWLVATIVLICVIFCKRIVEVTFLPVKPHEFAVYSVVLGLCLIGYVGYQESQKNNDNLFLEMSDTQRKITAYEFAKGVVEQRLKSPSTAKFPKSTTYIDHISDIPNGYYISSWVDSENSFGAEIRTLFSCKIIVSGTVMKCEELVLL